MGKAQDRLNKALGEHSGIPPCCIDFFIRHKWMPEALIVPWKREYMRALRSTKRDYVPCFECLATGRMVRIHRCDDYCGLGLAEKFVALTDFFSKLEKRRRTSPRCRQLAMQVLGLLRLNKRKAGCLDTLTDFFQSLEGHDFSAARSRKLSKDVLKLLEARHEKHCRS